MPLYLEYDASIFFFLFFLSCFFSFDPKTDHSYFTCHKKFVLFLLWVENEKKKQL